MQSKWTDALIQEILTLGHAMLLKQQLFRSVVNKKIVNKFKC